LKRTLLLLQDGLSRGFLVGALFGRVRRGGLARIRLRMVLSVAGRFGAVALVHGLELLAVTGLVEQNAALQTCSLGAFALGFKLEVLGCVDGAVGDRGHLIGCRLDRKLLDAAAKVVGAELQLVALVRDRGDSFFFGVVRVHFVVLLTRGRYVELDSLLLLLDLAGRVCLGCFLCGFRSLALVGALDTGRQFVPCLSLFKLAFEGLLGLY
jgi:hypothetical protein